MNGIKMLDLAQAVYDRYLRTDDEQRIEERRKAEVHESQGPVDPESIQARLSRSAMQLLGIDRPAASEADSSGAGVPAHTINPNPQIRA